MLCVSDSSQRLSRAHSYALEVIHLLIFVLQIQYFYNSFMVSQVCLEWDSIFLSDGVPVQRDEWVVHCRLHDVLLLDVLYDDTLMLSTLDLRQKSFVKILFCVLSCSSQGPSIWVWWWSIVSLAQRRSCSSDFSHRELVFLAPLSRSFFHDGRDPNVSTCQCLRLGMSWQRTIVSLSCWICGVLLECGVIFLLDHVSCVVLTLLCILLVHLVVIFLSVLCGASNTDSSTAREDDDDWSWLEFSCFMDEFCSLPFFRHVPPSVLQGLLQDVPSFWSPWTDPYIMSLRCMIPLSQSRLFWRHEHPFDANFFWFNLRVCALIKMIPTGSSTGWSGESACVPSGILRPLPSSPASAWGSRSAFFDSVPRFCAILPACRQYVMVCNVTANLRSRNSEFSCSRHDAC